MGQETTSKIQINILSFRRQQIHCIMNVHFIEPVSVGLRIRIFILIHSYHDMRE